MGCINHWIPACAGMTTGQGFRFVPDGYHSSRSRVPNNDRAFCPLPHLLFLCYFPMPTPSSFQRRLESRKAEAGCETDCDFPRSAGVIRLSFPLCGNVLNKSLDSSACVPDAALPPASMQAGLRRNDGGAGRSPGLKIGGIYCATCLATGGASF